MSHKQQTIDTYNATAAAMAGKFNEFGARVEDVKRGFEVVWQDIYELRDQKWFTLVLKKK